MANDKKLRPREDIERDFNNAMPNRRDEFLCSQREKLLLGVLLDIRELLMRKGK